MNKESEHDIQAALFQWAAVAARDYPALRWLFAIPNGTRTTPRVAAKMKAEGVLKGVSDIFLPCASGGKHGMFIEMKTATGRMSPEQKAFQTAMRDASYHAITCRGWEDAAEEIIKYLEELK